VDPQGRNRKCRPSVIVTATQDIKPDEPLVVVAISGEFRELPAEHYVKMLWHRAGHPKTKLYKPCAAICSWVKSISAADIEEFGGVVPPQHLAKILDKVSKLLEEQSG
jgi:hypothetical protein